MQRKMSVAFATLCAITAVAPATAAAGGPSENANCTAEFVVFNVIQAGAPRGASEDLAVIARPPKDFPPMSNAGFFSSTNCG